MYNQQNSNVGSDCIRSLRILRICTISRITMQGMIVQDRWVFEVSLILYNLKDILIFTIVMDPYGFLESELK